jgi:hypothetical protein
MPPIRITVEDFAELLQQWSDNEEPSIPTTSEAALLSRAISIAVAGEDVSGILNCLQVSKQLSIPITLEPKCQTLLLKFMNSTN